MEIRIQFRGSVFSLSIGYITKWFQSTSFVTVEQIWYDDHMKVEFAKLLYRS